MISKKHFIILKSYSLKFYQETYAVTITNIVHINICIEVEKY